MQAHASPIKHALLLAGCISLVSCEESQRLRQQADEINTKVQAIQQETQQMDMKMAQYRREIPAYAGAGEAGARQFAIQLASELVAAENEVARVQGDIQQAETALAEAQKELKAIQGKDPR